MFWECWSSGKGVDNDILHRRGGGGRCLPQEPSLCPHQIRPSRHMFPPVSRVISHFWNVCATRPQNIPNLLLLLLLATALPLPLPRSSRLDAFDCHELARRCPRKSALRSTTPRQRPQRNRSRLESDSAQEDRKRRRRHKWPTTIFPPRPTRQPSSESVAKLTRSVVASANRFACHDKSPLAAVPRHCPTHTGHRSSARFHQWSINQTRRRINFLCLSLASQQRRGKRHRGDSGRPRA